MSLNVQIVPSPAAAPDQLKALAAALERWFDGYVAGLASGGRDVDAWKDDEALADLRAGELPTPFVLRVTQDQSGLNVQDVRDALERARAAFPLVRRVMPSPTLRSVGFGFTVDGPGLDRDHVLTSLRQHVPLEYVADVIIDGQSWEQQG